MPLCFHFKILGAFWSLIRSNSLSGQTNQFITPQSSATWPSSQKWKGSNTWASIIEKKPHPSTVCLHQFSLLCPFQGPLVLFSFLSLWILFSEKKLISVVCMCWTECLGHFSSNTTIFRYSQCRKTFASFQIYCKNQKTSEERILQMVQDILT